MKEEKKGIKIEIKNLNLILSGNKILDDINLTIEPGTIHCFIGPNGGGKTSLIKCILGQMPHKGEIKYTYTDDNNKNIGYVPQILDFEKNLPITVENFMGMIYQRKPCFLGISQKYKIPIKELLTKINMYEKRHRLLGNLSGGERQRILLAQALYPTPNLLILDEPFTGIDKAGEEYFKKILLELKKEGTTILWIHHNLKQVKDAADFVTCIKQKVVFTGSPETELTDERIMEVFS